MSARNMEHEIRCEDCEMTMNEVAEIEVCKNNRIISRYVIVYCAKCGAELSHIRE